jgi:hypothetical protein
MTWAEHHIESGKLAAEAELEARRGDRERARELYGRAAGLEEQAAENLDPAKRRTLGITAVSAVSLYYKAGRLGEAERLAHGFLSSPDIPEFASSQLRGLLQEIWLRLYRKEPRAFIRHSKTNQLLKIRREVAGGRRAFVTRDLIVNPRWKTRRARGGAVKPKNQGIATDK